MAGQIDFRQEKNDECSVMTLIMNDPHTYRDAWIMWVVGMYAFLGKWGCIGSVYVFANKGRVTFYTQTGNGDV